MQTEEARSAREIRAQWDRGRSASEEELFAQLYQNGRMAGAKRITVTTAARDDGGTDVDVIDDGRGATSIAPFAVIGETGWNLPADSGEQPRGLALLRCFRHNDFTVRTRTGPGEDEAWNAFVIPDIVDGPERIPTEEPPDEKTPPHTGTRISFKTRASRMETQRAAHRAAAHLPVDVEVDDEQIKRWDYLERAAYRWESGGMTFGVYKTGRRSHALGCGGGVSLAGLMAHADMPRVETPEATWTVNVVMTAPVLGIRLEDAVSRELEESPATAVLKTQAERALYVAIADIGGDEHGLDTAGLARARELGVTIAPTKGRLAVWEPRAADQSMRPDVRRRSLLVTGGDSEMIIDLVDAEGDAEDVAEQECVTDTMILRALELNGRQDATFAANERFEGQAWYDRIPKVRHARCFAVEDETRTDIQEDKKKRLAAPASRTRLEMVLYGDRMAPVARMATDFGLTPGPGDGTTAAIYVPEKTSLTVKKLADLLARALFNADDMEDPYRGQRRFARTAEALASDIIEGFDQAHLRLMMRMVHDGNENMVRGLTDVEEASVVWSNGRLEAKITDTLSGKTISRSMSTAELDEFD